MARDVEETLRTLLIHDLALPEPLLVDRTASLHETIERMQSRRRPCVLVCDGRKVVGIFTERDVLDRVILEKPDPATPIEKLMTRDPRVLSLHDKVSDAIRLMTREGFRHIPLVDAEGAGTGLLSARDVLNYVADHFPAEVFNLPPWLHQSSRRVDGG